jgi:arylsulfatase A-like enzyme
MQKKPYRKMIYRGLSMIFYLFMAFGCSHKETPKSSKPNVIIIMTDDQGYGDMSCNGHPTLKTPNLDLLCNGGVQFSDFHVSPYCAPTRASLMTGRDFRRTGVWYTYGGRNWLNEEETTIADIFKFNNYATGHFGKWHLGDNYPFAPHFRGFDTSFMLGNSGMGAADGYWDNDRFDDTYYLNGKPVKTDGFGTDAFVDHALEFIEQHKDESFFVYLATNIPHRPWNIPSEYRKRYDSTSTDTIEVVPYSHTDMARFYGTIDKIDEQVGRVLTFLEEENLDKNTIVIFLTDNGTVSREYNAGMRERKGSPYEGGHRVPLFIRWPNGNIQPGKKINALTAHLDIAPTLIELCKLKTEKQLSFDGQSLVPLLYDEPSGWNQDRLYFSQMPQKLPGGYHVAVPKTGNMVVCKQKWRLVNDELYDLRSDPAQNNNLADSYPGIVRELKDSYEDHWIDIQPFTERIARVRIGNSKQPITKLSLSGITPNQGHPAEWSMAGTISAREINGKWPLFIEQSGKYEIELRRWPKETDRAINEFEGMGGRVPMKEFRKDAVQISPESARVKIGDTDFSKKINPTEKSVKFELTLEQGNADLQTWFVDQDGKSRTAYWVYLSRI